MNMEKQQLPEIIVGRIDRENDLLGHRTTWVVASQAFLFSAYAVSLAGTHGGARTIYAHRLTTLVVLLPWTAIVTLVLLYVTIVGSVRAILRLRVLCETPEPMERELVHGDTVSRRAGLTAPVLIPAVFLTTWLALVVSR
jgi:hypothetical protein